MLCAWVDGCYGEGVSVIPCKDYRRWSVWVQQVEEQSCCGEDPKKSQTPVPKFTGVLACADHRKPRRREECFCCCLHVGNIDGGLLPLQNVFCRAHVEPLMPRPDEVCGVRCKMYIRYLMDEVSQISLKNRFCVSSLQRIMTTFAFVTDCDALSNYY